MFGNPSRAVEAVTPRLENVPNRESAITSGQRSAAHEEQYSAPTHTMRGLPSGFVSSRADSLAGCVALPRPTWPNGWRATEVTADTSDFGAGDAPVGSICVAAAARASLKSAAVAGWNLTDRGVLRGCAMSRSSASLDNVPVKRFP